MKPDFRHTSRPEKLPYGNSFVAAGAVAIVFWVALGIFLSIAWPWL